MVAHDTFSTRGRNPTRTWPHLTCTTLFFSRVNRKQKREAAARVNPSRRPSCYLRLLRPGIDGSSPHLLAALAVGGGGDLESAFGVVARFLMVEFAFGLPSGIGMVVAMMPHWNKVSPDSPYLVNVSSVGEGPVRIGDVRSIGFYWILVVSVSFSGSCSLVYGGTSSISSFVLVYGKIRFLQPSGLVWRIASLQTMFHLCLVDLVVHDG